VPPDEARRGSGTAVATSGGNATEATMPDDTAQRSHQDQLMINVNEPHEVRYWTQRLGCSEQQLREAVAKAGAMAKDVRAILGRG